MLGKLSRKIAIRDFDFDEKFDFLFNKDTVSQTQGGHKPGKLGKLRELEKLLKSQGKLREIFYFCRKTCNKTQGKCEVCHIIINKNVFQGTFLCRVSQGKFGNTLEISGKAQGI